MSSTTGVTPRKTFNKRLAALEVREQVTKSADFTMSFHEVGQTVHTTKGSAQAVTLPLDATDTKILIGHGGSILVLGSQVTVAVENTGTLHKGGLTAKSLQAGAVITWEKVAANTYSISGDLAAS